jgi:hypothetical protein
MPESKTQADAMKFLNVVHANHLEAMKRAAPLMSRNPSERFVSLNAMG